MLLMLTPEEGVGVGALSNANFNSDLFLKKQKNGVRRYHLQRYHDQILAKPVVYNLQEDLKWL